VNGVRRPADLPRSNLVTFEAEDGGRLTARPSGTEPRIKFYLELVGRADDTAAVGPARARLEEEGQALRAAWMRDLGLA
jgi:phosphomannomutase